MDSLQRITILKRVVRVFAQASAAAVLLAGCFTPPVVGRAHSDSWTLETSDYPKDSSLVEVVHFDGDGDPAPTLRGIFVPSDTGAPVVVHFAESAASVTSHLHARGQYHDLAELGFASLAVDYRGVGLSDGEPSPRALEDDALAIWDHALGLVGGDSNRLLVRGCSLGTIAAASLLARGIRPAACIAIAPVRPQTVAKRYGYARFWNPAVWLAAPFLRTFSTADPLRWLGEPGVPRFVLTSPEDELLGERDFERLRSRVEASGGVMEVPERLRSVLINDDPIMKALKKHIGVSLWAFSVYTAESAFLAERFPDLPNLEERRERIARLGSRGAVAAVWSEPNKLARLDQVLARHRSAPPDLLLAAANLWTLEEMDSFDAWFLPVLADDDRETYWQRSYSQLLKQLELGDPGGRLPIELIVAARRLLGQDVGRGGQPRWSRARIEALLHAFFGEEVPGRVFATDGSTLAENESWRFGVAEKGRVTYAERQGTVTQSGTLSVAPLAEAFAADAEGRSEAEARRRLRKCLLKAAGIS
ncbi:Alpha/beta hydrolase family protein [Planctomycetes bacterium Poly30]|uniref:Alpha/beta hydrolase family protein n=1 Tax=Saltatorellus ferox TaxID=2528018 RepID=A0A518EMN1_9BACT|nr:Alpha/beta hydrolase family protein [Planctomycetes bacterium Poly30]